MKWNEIIQDEAWVVNDLLTHEECQHFMDEANAKGINDNVLKKDRRNRDSNSVWVDDKLLAQRVFERIKDHIPQKIVIDESTSLSGVSYHKGDLIGTWTPYALNERWRIVCYPGRGHFGPHRDGHYQVDEHHRSLVTVNCYLTDRPIGFGGATRFVKDTVELHTDGDGIFTTPEDDVLHRIEADSAGKAVVFLHDLMHDGEPLKEGSPAKWLGRTEVMYTRDPSTAPQKTPDQLEAKRLLKEAEKFEEQSLFAEAQACYRKAYRLDPSLE